MVEPCEVTLGAIRSRAAGTKLGTKFSRRTLRFRAGHVQHGQRVARFAATMVFPEPLFPR